MSRTVSGPEERNNPHPTGSSCVSGTALSSIRMIVQKSSSCPKGPEQIIHTHNSSLVSTYTITHTLYSHACRDTHFLVHYVLVISYNLLDSSFTIWLGAKNLGNVGHRCSNHTNSKKLRYFSMYSIMWTQNSV